MFPIRHVNYNLQKLFLTMNQTFTTGLRLKNSLTNELVTPTLTFRKNSFPVRETTSAGTPVDPPSILTATWDMPGTTSATI